MMKFPKKNIVSSEAQIFLSKFITRIHYMNNNFKTGSYYYPQFIFPLLLKTKNIYITNVNYISTKYAVENQQLANCNKVNNNPSRSDVTTFLQ